jgi:hypothetical protein
VEQHRASHSAEASKEAGSLRGGGGIPGAESCVREPRGGLKKRAAESPALLAKDSDGDGYSNEVELRFGSKPGRRNSHPSRSAAQLERWNIIIARELHGKQIARLELDSRIRRVGPDTDGDRVPDVLERLVGSDPRARSATPLLSARRLALYRQLLLDTGVMIR